MADEEPSVGGGAFGGTRSSSGGITNVTASVGMRLDKTVAKQWLTTYDDLAKKVKVLRGEIKELNKEANKTTRAVQGRLAAGSAGNPSTSTASATASAIATTTALASGGGAAGGGGGGGGAHPRSQKLGPTGSENGLRATR